MYKRSGNVWRNSGESVVVRSPRTRIPHPSDVRRQQSRPGRATRAPAPDLCKLPGSASLRPAYFTRAARASSDETQLGGQTYPRRNPSFHANVRGDVAAVRIDLKRDFAVFWGSCRNLPCFLCSALLSWTDFRPFSLPFSAACCFLIQSVMSLFCALIRKTIRSCWC